MKSPSRTCMTCGFEGLQVNFPMYKSGNRTYYRRRCFDCWRKRVKENNDNRQAKIVYGDSYTCVKCNQEKLIDQFYDKGQGYIHTRCKPCFDKDRKRTNTLRDKRLICLKAYGSRCVCCEVMEDVFLAFDHINNDGAEHRQKVRTGYSFYKWLIDNEFPDSIQILCFNCNWAKYRGGCPHQAVS